MTRRLTHPHWCGRHHHCTAPAGEHRSAPLAWPTAYGRLIATRVLTADGRHRLELRAVVDLDPSEQAAGRQARHTAVLVDLAVRRATGRSVQRAA